MTSKVKTDLIKIIDTIDIEPILKCYYQLESNMVWTEYDKQGRQTGLQYLTDEDPWNSAVGKSRGRELEYINLNPYFSDTIFQEIINKYNFKRTRLMWVAPKSCYSMHRDSTPRVHIPLITNKECYFVLKHGVIHHMKAGHVHYTDTRFPHTFMNCSDEKRLHLVGVIDK